VSAGTDWNLADSFRLARSVFTCMTSVAEPLHFYAAPAPGKRFDAAPALAPVPAPTLLYSKTKFLKRTKV
jgi:hypothetical protein